jgi:hypothetical protein
MRPTKEQSEEYHRARVLYIKQERQSGNSTPVPEMHFPETLQSLRAFCQLKESLKDCKGCGNQ